MSELKVTFTDKKNKYQYDGHAHCIGVNNVISKGKGNGGKLYLGDRDSCSMVQIKHRDISCVVNAQGDMHGLCKEDVKYLKIDPVDNNKSCLELAFRFIDQALEAGNNVLICCHTGLGKSAAILIYYLMKKDAISFADAHRRIEEIRFGLRPDSKTSGFRPDLVKLLLAEEKVILQTGKDSKSKGLVLPSAGLEERTLVYLDGKGDMLGASSNSSSNSSGGGDIWTPGGGGSSSSNSNNSKSKEGSSNGNGMQVVAIVVLLCAVLYGLFSYAVTSGAGTGSNTGAGSGRGSRGR